MIPETRRSSEQPLPGSRCERFVALSARCAVGCAQLMSVTSPQSVGIHTGSVAGRAARKKREGLWDNYFYFAMSLLMTVIVVYGFSRTMGERIIHPKTAPPTIVY